MVQSPDPHPSCPDKMTKFLIAPHLQEYQDTMPLKLVQFEDPAARMEASFL